MCSFTGWRSCILGCRWPPGVSDFLFFLQNQVAAGLTLCARSWRRGRIWVSSPGVFPVNRLPRLNRTCGYAVPRLNPCLFRSPQEVEIGGD